MDKKDKPRITPAALSALASGNLHNFRVASTPGGIEAQEKAGQLSFCATTTLPAEGLKEWVTVPGHLNKPLRTVLEAWGVKFGKMADDIFIEAFLPAGWKKEPTDHDMWSNLVDDKGKVVAKCFYKAAFYDRRARINLAVEPK